MTLRRKALKRLLREDSGATAVATAIVMSVLLGLTALGVEVGFWYAERRAMQTAADAAAISAAYQVYEGGTEAAEIAEAGKKDAARNGFADGIDNVSITINNPPTTGTNSGNEYAAEVIVASQRRRLLSSVLLDGDVLIRTRAVAVVRVSGPFCVLALDPSSSGTLSFAGTTDLTLENCGIVVNSSSSSAMTLEGAATVGATYADITGNYTETNNATLDLEEGSPNTGVDPLDDPFEHLDVPSGTGCDYDNHTVTKKNSATLDPGRYCGGLTILAGAKVTLNPGNYIIVGGTLRIEGGATVIGTGVTFFLTGSGTNYAQVSIAGGAVVKITAPTSGTYRGIAFFQDRNAPSGNGYKNTFNGGSTMEIMGAIYVPKQKVVFTGGNASAGGCTKIVSFTIQFTGNSNVNSDCTAFGFEDEVRHKPTLKE